MDAKRDFLEEYQRKYRILNFDYGEMMKGDCMYIIQSLPNPQFFSSTISRVDDSSFIFINWVGRALVSPVERFYSIHFHIYPDTQFDTMMICSIFRSDESEEEPDSNIPESILFFYSEDISNILSEIYKKAELR